jgi:hypothetical protein
VVDGVTAHQFCAKQAFGQREKLIPHILVVGEP